MRFLVDHKRKVAFGWSAKAGCRHVKMLVAYLVGLPGLSVVDTPEQWLHAFESDILHHMRQLSALRERTVIKGYTVFMVVRNPFKRIVSAYLRVLRPGSDFAKKLRIPTEGYTLMHALTDVESKKWVRDTDFVQHFHPQTAEDFATGARGCTIVVWNIANIDYARLEELYSTPIPSVLREWQAESPDRHPHLEPRWHTAQLEPAHLDAIRRIYRLDFQFLEAHGVNCSPPTEHHCYGGMQFLVDHERKVAVGWSAKAGCRHVHLVHAYLTGRFVDRVGSDDRTWLPRFLASGQSVTDIDSCPEVPRGFAVFLVMRDPRERLVSGFIRTLRDHPKATTIDALLADLANTKSWVYDNEHVAHHLCPQTNGGYNTLNATHTVRVWDLSKIDYGALERLYGVTIPDNVRACRTDIPDPPLETEPLLPHATIRNDAVFDRVFARDLTLWSSTT